MSTDTKYTACCKTLINSDKFWTLWLSQGFIFRIRHRDAGTLYGREGQNPNNFWQLHYSYSNQGVGNRALIRILSPRRLFNSTLTHVCKGQIISKANCQTVNSSKKRTNEFDFTTMRRVFVHFLEEIEDTNFFLN